MNNMGVCGDNCAFCPRYLATQSGDAGELEKVKELWVRLGLRDPDFPAQNLACSGCKPENACAYPEVRTCAQGERIATCGLCHAYPCTWIHTVFEKSEEFRWHAAQVCTPEEMDALNKAFLCKPQNLDRMHSARDSDQ